MCNGRCGVVAVHQVIYILFALYKKNGKRAEQDNQNHRTKTEPNVNSMIASLIALASGRVKNPRFVSLAQVKERQKSKSKEEKTNAVQKNVIHSLFVGLLLHLLLLLCIVITK